jgi:hypothetical protein
MKKIISIISMLMLIYMGTSAQSGPFQNSSTSIYIDLYNDFTPLAELDESLLFTTYRSFYWGSTFYFFKLDKETHEFTQKYLGYTIANLFTIYNEGMVMNIQAVNNDKTKTLSFMKTEFPVNEIPEDLKYEEIKSMPFNPKDELDFSTAISPDKSKYCTLIRFFDDEKKFKGTHIIVFDREGNILWEKDEEYSITPNYVYTHTFISNEGKIYVIYKTFDEWTKEEKFEIFKKRDALLSGNNFKVTSLNVLVFSENDFYQQVENTDFGKIQSFEACLTREGNLFVGGYFANPDNLKKTIGVFSFLYDKSADLISKKINHLENDYMPDNFSGYEQKEMRENDFVTRAAKIYELENGNLVMLSEQIYLRGDEHFIKNIIANTFLKDGSLIKTTVIPSAYDFDDSYSSLSLNSRTYTFSSFCEGSDIYIFYNGNKKNFVEPEEQWLTFEGWDFKNATVLLTKLSDDGNYQTKMVLPPVPKKNHLIHSAFAHNDNTAYVFLYLGNGYFKFETLDYDIF